MATATATSNPDLDPLLTPRRREWLAVFLTLLEESGEARSITLAEAGRRAGGMSATAARDHFLVLRARGYLPPDCLVVWYGRQERAGDEEPGPEERAAIEARRRAIRDGWSMAHARRRSRWAHPPATIPGAERSPEREDESRGRPGRDRGRS